MIATIRTVKRNSREAREMWDQATRAVSYTLDGYFIGRDIDVEAARAWFDHMVAAGSHVRISSDAPGHYTIRYHSNHWTELLCPPKEA